MAEPSEIHDLLVIPSNKKLYRFKASEDGFPGQAPVDYYADEHRNVMNIARTGPHDNPRGPAFAVLPNKPDPATSQICCYLVNSQNIRAANPWTSAAWSSEPELTTTHKGLAFRESVRDVRDFALLVATAEGAVYLVRKGQTPEQLDLALETEVFGLLRNGLVAGSAYCQRTQTVLPLVNVTSIALTEAH